MTHGFEVAGGILPAVGFGLLLRVMFKAQYIPYLIAGFLFVCYIQVSNLLPVAVLGAGFAVYEFFNAKSRQQAQPQPVASKNEEEDYSNGIEISKKDITRLGFRSSLLQASFNYERMQAGGFTWRCCRS